MLQLGACAQELSRVAAELFWSISEKPVPTLHTQQKALAAQVGDGSRKEPPQPVEAPVLPLGWLLGLSIPWHQRHTERTRQPGQEAY